MSEALGFISVHRNDLVSHIFESLYFTDDKVIVLRIAKAGFMKYGLGDVISGWYRARDQDKNLAKLPPEEVLKTNGNNYIIPFSEISKVGNKLNLPRSVLETASHIYRKAVKEGLVRGRSIQGVLTGAIYLACRQCKTVRTLDDMSQATKTDRKEIGRCYRFLLKKMNVNVPFASPGQFIAKYFNQLGIQGNSINIAHKILSQAKELKLTSGRGPSGLAAAICYISLILTGEGRTQRELAEVAQVTEVTIRNRYKELVNHLQFKIYF